MTVEPQAVSERARLHGLLLPSGNDAAIALAQRAGGSVKGFVRLMNLRARAMGLTCTRFSSPDGYEDRVYFGEQSPDYSIVGKSSEGAEDVELPRWQSSVAISERVSAWRCCGRRNRTSVRPAGIHGSMDERSAPSSG